MLNYCEEYIRLVDIASDSSFLCRSDYYEQKKTGEEASVVSGSDGTKHNVSIDKKHPK